MKPKIGSYIAFSIFTLAGVVFGVLGLKFWLERYQMMQNGIETTGVIRFFLVTFLVMVGIGLASLIHLIRQQRMYKLLRERGQVVQARFSRAVSSWKFEKAPIRLVATWTDPKTQIVHTFMSDFLPGNTDLSEVEKKGNIPVTINPENPSQHWMDLSSFRITQP